MFQFDPLTNYHAQLRGTRASGYPMMPLQSPHPYEMAMYHAMPPQQTSYPFQQQQGYPLRMNINPGGGGYRQGIARRTQRQNRGYRIPNYALAPSMMG